MAKKKPTPKRPWVPLRFSHMEGESRIYGNDRYTVTAHELKASDGSDETMTVLGIHTHTRSTVGAHDWRHFQRIKNEICGEERWGVEIYPAESKLLDTANEYWLWVMPEGMEPGFGFHEPRSVQNPEDIANSENPRVRARARQRKLDPDTPR